MYSGIEDQSNNTCLDCNLKFDSPHELQNHKRKFCLHSGYDNLEGLAKIQWQGSPPQRPHFSHKNHLQKYGAHSLSHLQEQPLSASGLNTDMRQIEGFRRQIDRTNKYKRSEYKGPGLGLSQMSYASKQELDGLNETRLSHNSYSESRLDEQLKKYEKPLREQTDTSPTFIEHLNMKNQTMLDKSNSTMAKMSPSDKLEYAKTKLDELRDIKTMYIQNGGNKHQFKANVDKMIAFYQNFVKEQQDSVNQQQSGELYGSQNLIESRCSTPILKLRNFQENNDKMSQKGSRMTSNSQAMANRGNINQKNHNNNNNGNNNISNNNNSQHPYFNSPVNGMATVPFGYPPMMVMPYPQSQSSDSMRLLEKMMELKSEENKQLMEILLQQRNKSQPQNYNRHNSNQYNRDNYQSSKVEPVSLAGFKKDKDRKGVIDVEENYQFKKSMIDDLISQEKVLLALQQEELDQLKLLSQLPKQLQEMKVQSVIKASQTRFQVEKELLKQKMQRLAYQEENQTFEEERKLSNDRWAGEERKKLLEQQVDKYLDNFQSHFVQG